jgi:hypothetical protein
MSRDIRITNAMNANTNDLIPLMAYLHQDTREGVGDVRGHEIAVLLDTGALGIDGNYISAKLANEIDSQRKLRVLSNIVVICNGVDGGCVDENYFSKIKKPTCS